VLANPLARPTALRVALLTLPAPMLHVMTWSALALELLYAPLALSRRARPVIWTLTLFMHIGLLVLIDFADLSVAMIVVQLFTFDPEWLGVLFKRLRDFEMSASVFVDRHLSFRHHARRIRNDTRSISDDPRVISK